MADEFAKGLGIFTGAGLAWVVLASWYRTSSFESTHQLVEPVVIAPGQTNVFNALGILLMDVLFWFAVLGALAFWVVVPVGRQARRALDDRRNAE